jgi:hypothetical protein
LKPERGASLRFFNRIMQQMSELTVNHAALRKRRYQLDGEVADGRDPDVVMTMPQSASLNLAAPAGGNSNSLQSTSSGKTSSPSIAATNANNQTKEAAVRKCSTLPTRLDYTPGITNSNNFLIERTPGMIYYLKMDYLRRYRVA